MRIPVKTSRDDMKSKKAKWIEWQIVSNMRLKDGTLKYIYILVKPIQKIIILLILKQIN